METSELFRVLDAMPKGAVHHIHTTAAPPVDVYLEMTRHEYVYYNDREKVFRVYPEESMKEDGFV